MERSSLGLKLPEGMRDLLPAELARLQDLEAEALLLCKNWAYQKVLTPGLEYRASIEPEPDKEDYLYKFFDQNGHILVLRPEFTIPIARMVASGLKGEVFPLRFSYSGDVYRKDSARYREFRQVGVELIGSDSEIADAEVIALAVEMMKAFGTGNFQLSLGHNGIFSGLAEEMDFDPQLRRELEDGIARKDIVKLESVVYRSGLPETAKELLLSLRQMNGKQDALNKLRNWSHIPSICRAVDSLRAIFSYLHDFGVQEYVSLDLGILKGFSYYTGAVLEGYLPGIGIPVIEGGRYDTLYADFGFNLPATGFAVNLGIIADQAPVAQEDGPEVLVFGRTPAAVIKRCQELRMAGMRVEMAINALSVGEAAKLVSSRGISRLEEVKE